MTLTISDIQHINDLPLIWVSHFIYYFSECHYAECRYAECHYAEYHYAVYRCAECYGAKFDRKTFLFAVALAKEAKASIAIVIVASIFANMTFPV